MESPPNQQIRLERQPWSHHLASRSVWRGSHGIPPPPPPPHPQQIRLEKQPLSRVTPQASRSVREKQPRSHLPASRSVTPQRADPSRSYDGRTAIQTDRPWRQRGRGLTPSAQRTGPGGVLGEPTGRQDRRLELTVVDDHGLGLHLQLHVAELP